MGNPIALIGSALGLGLSSGLNLYATVLVVGLGIHFNLIHLSPELRSLEILDKPAILLAAGIAFTAEFFADKVPWVDSLWDLLHTFIRPVGAAVVGAASLGSVDPAMKVTIGILCGGVGLSGHSTKTGLRIISNHSPEPFSNIGLSILEDLLAAGGAWLSLTHPVIALGLVATFIVLFAWFAPILVRKLRIHFTAISAVLRRLLHKTTPRTVLCNGTWSRHGLSEGVHDLVISHLEHTLAAVEPEFCIRCAAGHGMAGLRDSVGHLFVTPGAVIFAARRSLKPRHHEIDRADIQEVHHKKGLLLDRMTLRAGGKHHHFLFFKDNNVEAQWLSHILKPHRPQPHQAPHATTPLPVLCAGCGVKTAAEAKYCEQCGAPVRIPPVQSTVSDQGLAPSGRSLSPAESGGAQSGRAQSG